MHKNAIIVILCLLLSTCGESRILKLDKTAIGGAAN